MVSLSRYLPGLPALGVLLTLLSPATLRAQGDCLDCHSSADDVGEENLVVDFAAWEVTVHGAAGIDCTDCHTGKIDGAHEADHPSTVCSDCHGDVVEAMTESIHGRMRVNGGRGPDCGSCHGPIHEMTWADDPASRVHPTRLAATCGSCHSDPTLADKRGLKLVQPIAAYTASVHARAVARGEHAATCSACHGSHDILKADDEGSRVHHSTVAGTCGVCHEEIAEVFARSVHGRASASGIGESPTCFDCHGEHGILGPADKGSPVYASNVPTMTCGRCHGDLRVTAKFGMKADAVTAFQDSFHGLASRSGSITVANCASCHGVHDILPSSDRASHIHPQNLVATCGACHPGAGETIALSEVHVLPGEKDSAHPAVYWVRVAYLWLIYTVIGGMLLHNFFDLRRKALAPISRPVVPVAERRERLNLGFRIAHAATAISFIVLAYTGFALKFPDAWWSRPLLIWEDSFAARGWIHRIAALVAIAAFVFHFVHIAVSRRARACILAMLPTRHDLVELRERLAWYFGRTPRMPHAPPLGYIEKAEYLALIWGTLVMAVTGFLLWFENFSLGRFPLWVTDVATVIHFYEAILATLAIVVWHFYWVLFDPLVYPMDTAWYTGREVPGRTLERSASTIEPTPDRKA
jgi:cytochrome b subunit of formate dehydrogenase